jgi:hypothetical protein
MKLLLLDTADIKVSLDTEGSKMEIDLFSFHSFPVYKMKQHFFCYCPPDKSLIEAELKTVHQREFREI